MTDIKLVDIVKRFFESQGCKLSDGIMWTVASRIEQDLGRPSIDLLNRRSGFVEEEMLRGQIIIEYSGRLLFEAPEIINPPTDLRAILHAD